MENSGLAQTEKEDSLRYTEHQILGTQELQREQKKLVANFQSGAQRTLPPKTTKQYIDKIHTGMRSLGNANNVTITIEEDLEVDEMRQLMEGLSVDASRTVPLDMILAFIYQTFDLEKTQLLCSALEQPGLRYLKELDLTQCRFTNESWMQLCKTLAKRECAIETITLDRAPRLEDFGLNSLATVCSSRETRLTKFIFQVNTSLFYRLADFIVQPAISMPQIRLLSWDAPEAASEKEEDEAIQCLMNAIKRSNVKLLIMPYQRIGTDKTYQDLHRLSKRLSSKWFKNATVLLSALCVPRLSGGAFKSIPKDLIRDLLTQYIGE